MFKCVIVKKAGHTSLTWELFVPRMGYSWFIGINHFFDKKDFDRILLQCNIQNYYS